VSRRVPPLQPADLDLQLSHPTSLTQSNANNLSDEESRQLVTSPPPLRGEPQHELEYIKSMIAVAKDDVQHVYIFAAAALGLAGIFITQIPVAVATSLPILFRAILVLGTYSLAASSLLFFRYGRSIHLVRMRMIRCLPTLDVVRVRELWAGPHGGWQKNRRFFKLGQWLFALGIVCVAIVLGAVLLR
jgi:hypothetical protein